MKTAPFLSGAALALFCASGEIHAAIPPLTLKPVSLNQLQAPTTITNAGDGSGRLFICEQRGRIMIFKDGMLQPTPFLNLSSKLVPERAGFDERGLIGLTFHPGYANPASPGYRRFYVFYSATSPNAPGPAANPVDCQSVIAEYLVSLANPNVADLASERILMTFDKPQFNHNGGQVEFGPDGLLYIATGDGGSSNDNNVGHTGGSSARPTNALGNSQDRTKPMGKLLRIDPLGNNGPGGQYGIPPTNPFVGVGGGVREEIYAYGLRNPWRFSFDPPTGRLFVADVGQGNVEEVNIITSGGNFGWRNREGTFVPSFSIDAPAPGVPLIDPIAQYAHPGVVIGSPALPQIGISITGGYLYRGSAIPALQGKYVFADYSSSVSQARGIMLGLEETTPNNWTFSTLTLTNGNPLLTRIYAMGRDEQGELYVGTNTTLAPSQLDPSTGLPAGGLYKIVAPASEPAVAVLDPSKDNTIYSAAQANSNGQGHIHAGRNPNGGLTRGLVAFNLTGAVPTGAPLLSAQLAMDMNKTTQGPFPVSLHRVSADWGEGTSDAGENSGAGVAATTNDATWTHRFFNTASTWTTLGGDFNATASATTTVDAVGPYTWTGAGLLSDVSAWLATPLQNFGWLLRGDETVSSSKRFSSGENFTPASRPKLTITYLAAPPLTRREAWLQQYFHVGQFIDDLADLEGDTEANLVEYAYAHSPIAGNAAVPGLNIATAAVGPNTVFTITFRRDPRATDLTYELLTSSDLATWNIVVTSTAGGAPTGSAFVSDNVIAGESPVRLVTAQQTAPTPAQRFARLRILRQP